MSSPDGGGTRLCQSRFIYLNGCEPSRIVLTDRGEGTYERYVTHIEAVPSDRPAYCVRGHYFNDLVEAARDFGERFERDKRAEQAQLQTEGSTRA